MVSEQPFSEATKKVDCVSHLIEHQGLGHLICQTCYCKTNEVLRSSETKEKSRSAGILVEIIERAASLSLEQPKQKSIVSSGIVSLFLTLYKDRCIVFLTTVT